MRGQDDDIKHVYTAPGGDRSQMPKLSKDQQRFMALMSGIGGGSRRAANQNGASQSRLEDDPAFAVEVVEFFWRYCRRGMPMPKRAMRLLERHAAAGDPTCILVRDWLRTRMAGTVGAHGRSLWVFEGGRKG